MTAPTSADRKVSAKAAAKKRPQTWKPGQSGNPAGGPKRGESWAEIIKAIGDLTPQEAADMSAELAKNFRRLGDGITLKQAVILRVYGSLLFEPQPGLLNAFMNRVEGMPSQSVDVTSKGNEINITTYDYGTAIAALASRPVDDSESPSEDKDSLHGETLRQDSDGG